MEIIVKVLFAVCMLLWAVGAFAAPEAPPYTRGRNALAWLSVFFLSLLVIVGPRLG